MNNENKQNENINFKSGFVAIVGNPNVGKSTLLNNLSAMKLAIVSPKPQTTRHNIRLIINEEDSQIIITDTPGMHSPKNRLGKKMVEAISEALIDSDVIILMIDAKYPKITETETRVCEIAKQNDKKVILLINKIDLIPKDKVLPIIEKYTNFFQFESIIPISATKEDGIDILKSEIKKLLPVGPLYYPEDSFTDQTQRGISSELIREQILKFTSQEIPHGTAVEIEKFEENISQENTDPTKKDIVKIYASIICERKSHKKMLVGKDGEMIKRIGTNARKQIEIMMQKQVYLELHVKVRDDWRNNYSILKNLGYDK